MTTATTSAEAQAEFEAQGAIPSGTEGWWRIWGASARHVRAGDLVLTLVDDELKYDLVQELFEAKAAPMRWGYVADGERLTLGALYPFHLLRWGTKHTLAR
jgi:hypothetical protein